MMCDDRHFFLAFFVVLVKDKKRDENKICGVEMSTAKKNNSPPLSLCRLFYFYFLAIFSPKLFGIHAASIKTVATLMPPNFACR